MNFPNGDSKCSSSSATGFSGSWIPNRAGNCSMTITQATAVMKPRSRALLKIESKNPRRARPRARVIKPTIIANEAASPTWSSIVLVALAV